MHINKGMKISELTVKNLSFLSLGTFMVLAALEVIRSDQTDPTKSKANNIF